MSSFKASKFLSLIPELHESAVIMDDPAQAIESSPQSPDAVAIDQIEKTRRSSSSASAQSVPGDAVSALQGKQFLKLGS